MRRRRIALALLAASALLSPASRGFAQAMPGSLPGCRPGRDTTLVGTAPLDSLTELFADDSFSSILDGQPEPPGRVELSVDIWWARQTVGPQPVRLDLSSSYTPPWTDFLRNTQMSLLTTLWWERDGPQLRVLGIGWQQRWLADVLHGLVLSTYLEADLLSGTDNSGTALMVAGIAGLVVGPGVVFLNISGTKGGGEGQDALFGLVAYKLLLGKAAYLHAGIVTNSVRGQRSASMVELAGVFVIGGAFAISPGALFGLGHREVTPTWGVGLALTWDL